MTDITERLHTIRATLRTGALGQREVWEEWLDEAADEIVRLRAKIIQLTAEDFKALGLTDVLEDEVKALRAEIEELKK